MSCADAKQMVGMWMCGIYGLDIWEEVWNLALVDLFFCIFFFVESKGGWLVNIFNKFVVEGSRPSRQS